MNEGTSIDTFSGGKGLLVESVQSRNHRTLKEKSFVDVSTAYQGLPYSVVSVLEWGVISPKISLYRKKLQHIF